MANVICQGAYLEVLDQLVSTFKLNKIHLFKNDHVPAVTDTVAAFTEADFSGYLAITPIPFNAAFINGDDKGEIDADPVTWNHSGGATSNTVFGIYVTTLAGDLFYAERFGAPIVMANFGDSITYTAKMTCVNE